MIRIKLSTTLRWPIERQIPTIWKEQGIEVFVNKPIDRCDAWVVYQGLHRPDETIVPPERTYFFSYEPPGLHHYQERFLAQFAKVITCQREILHPNVVHRHQAQPWLVGIQRHDSENRHEGTGVSFSFDDLARMKVPEKPLRLSSICSSKVMVKGHQTRLAFIEELRNRVGKDIDVFGYGFQPIKDKWGALAPYQYHLVLENSCLPDYWTEKLADAFLAWSMPIVWGCPNLSDYFPDDSFVSLDPYNIAESADRIKELIARPPNAGQMGAVSEARRRVLENYNLFSEILALINAAPGGDAVTVRLKDERLFLPAGRLRPLVRAMTDRWRAKKKPLAA